MAARQRERGPADEWRIIRWQLAGTAHYPPSRAALRPGGADALAARHSGAAPAAVKIGNGKHGSALPARRVAGLDRRWLPSRGWRDGPSSKTAPERNVAILPVPPFDPALLPDALRPWLMDVAERMQCPADFPAVAAIVALAGVVGRQVAIRPKRRDDWPVIPNLWGGMVAPPGLLKTPAHAEAMKPLKWLEIRAAAEYAEADPPVCARAMVGKVRKQVAEQAIKRAVKSGGDNADDLAAESVEESRSRADPPAIYRQRPDARKAGRDFQARTRTA